jgi:hypothetical protein
MGCKTLDFFQRGADGMRSPCAGAALDPPLWIVPNQALSLSRAGGGKGRLCEKRRGGVLLLFITAVPNTKLCAWGEEDSGGHVL